MEVHEAIKTAKNVVAEMFEAEEPTNIGLEELEYDDASDAWNVTVGFSRRWDRPSLGVLDVARWGKAEMPVPLRRTYKIVALAKADGKLISISNREV